MGKLLTIDERLELLAWASTFKTDGLIKLSLPVSRSLKDSADLFLRNYWGLCRTARNLKIPEDIRKAAHLKLFPVRTKIESWLQDSASKALQDLVIQPIDLLDGTVFGCSLKQGVSFRLPLKSCQPTEQCAGGCYAHDGLDASVSTVIRGSLNGAFAQHYEESDNQARAEIMKVFSVPIKKAVAHALKESRLSTFPRAPRIRMSHVGELPAFPSFANAMAEKIREFSNGEVKCILYTRHKGISLLDSNLFVINFTLDKSSINRRSWAPVNSRIVYSAWGGSIRKDVAINFLEHHHLEHLPSLGSGKICPATKPETSDKTCDGVKCDLCFQTVT